MEKTEAVLDSDFLQGILKYSSGEFLKQLMDELNVRPVVHSYVAEVELQYCTEAQQLINSGYIRKVDYSEYLLTESEIAQAKINSARYTLKVKNLSELLQQVGSCENKLKWKDVKAVLREERWKKEKEKLHPLWNKTI